MDNLGYAVLMGLLVGAGGTGVGALLTFFIKKTGKKLSAVLLGISGGIMLVMVCLDMLPEAWEEGGWLPVVLGVAAGALVLFLITKLVPHHDAAEYDTGVVSDIRTKSLVRSGMLLAMGIAIHNLPQGIALGGGITSGFGLSLAVLLLLHNIPEGMAMAIPLKIGNVPRSKIMWLAVLAALPTAVGAAIGAAVSNISGTFIAASVAFAGGAMLYLTLKELIPQAVGMNKTASTAWAILAGGVIGGVIIWLIG